MVAIVNYIDILFRGVIGFSIGFEKVIKGGGIGFSNGVCRDSYTPPKYLSQHFQYFNLKYLFVRLANCLMLNPWLSGGCRDVRQGWRRRTRQTHRTL